MEETSTIGTYSLNFLIVNKDYNGLSGSDWEKNFICGWFGDIEFSSCYNKIFFVWEGGCYKLFQI